jgi:uncharacterized membrane protein YeiH
VLTVLTGNAATDMNLPDGVGRRPLHSVVEPAFIPLLIDRKADVAAVSQNQNRYTMLHTVKDAVLAKAFLNAGAELAAENNAGETALHVGMCVSVCECNNKCV